MSVRASGANKCHACYLAATALCDWKMPNGGLCNRANCPDHALQVGPNKHLCPEHREAWEAHRLASREAQEAAPG